MAAGHRNYEITDAIVCYVFIFVAKHLVCARTACSLRKERFYGEITSCAVINTSIFYMFSAFSPMLQGEGKNLPAFC